MTKKIDKEQLIAMFYEGSTSKFLAMHFGISKSMVSFILSEHLDTIEEAPSDETYIRKVERVLDFELKKEAISKEKLKFTDALIYEYVHFNCKTFN